MICTTLGLTFAARSCSARERSLRWGTAGACASANLTGRSAMTSTSTTYFSADITADRSTDRAAEPYSTSSEGCCRASSRAPEPSSSRAPESRHDARALDVVEPGELAHQIRVAPVEHGILLTCPNPAPGALAVVGVQRVGSLHALDDLGKWHEGLFVVGVPVVAQVDEDLRGAAVRVFERVRHGAPDVRLPARIIWNHPRSPDSGDLGCTVNPELHPVPSPDPEESRLVIEARADEVVEP